MHEPTRRAGAAATLAAAVRSAAAYLFVGTYTLLVGPPALLLAIVFKWPGILYTLGIFAVRVALQMAGIRYRVAGREHIPDGGAAVYCVNHTSNVEPPVVFAILRNIAPRLRIMYKQQLRGLPILGRCFDIAGFVPVDRGNTDQTRMAVEQAAQGLREGYSFVIFPEGTRSRTGELLPFKTGGFVMAIKAGAPVVPMAVEGARRAMRKGSFLIHPVCVHVRLGAAIDTTGMDVADKDALVERVRTRIAEMLAEGPVDGPDTHCP